MDLPILQSPQQASQQDLIRHFHRTGLHWAEQLADAVQLDAGVAIANPKFPRVRDANHLRDAVLQVGITPPQALAEVEAHFRSVGTRCFYWMMNPSAPPDQTAPLVKYLLERGYQPNVASIMRLSRLPDKIPSEYPGLKILPARAAFKQMRLLCEESEAEWGPLDSPQLVEARLQRLDDPHWDCLLALKDGIPVATAGVLSVGDLGRVEDVYVSQRFRHQGIGSMIVHRVLEICARSLFKHVLLEVRPDNFIAINLYSRFGFNKIGEITAYNAPGI